MTHPHKLELIGWHQLIQLSPHQKYHIAESNVDNYMKRMSPIQTDKVMNILMLIWLCKSPSLTSTPLLVSSQIFHSRKQLNSKKTSHSNALTVTRMSYTQNKTGREYRMMHNWNWRINVELSFYYLLLKLVGLSLQLDTKISPNFHWLITPYL